jgi:hypothetical protein
VGERNQFDPSVFDAAKAAVERVGARYVGGVDIDAPADWGSGVKAATKTTIKARFSDKEAAQAFMRALGDGYELSTSARHDCVSCSCRIKATATWTFGDIVFYAYDAVETTKAELLARAAAKVKAPADGAAA